MMQVKPSLDQFVFAIFLRPNITRTAAAAKSIDAKAADSQYQWMKWSMVEPDRNNAAIRSTIDMMTAMQIFETGCRPFF